MDLPKEPDSATVRLERVLVVCACASGLEEKILVSFMSACSRGNRLVLIEDHGVGALDAIFADVALVVGHIVQD